MNVYDRQYKVIKDIHEGWECGAEIGDILIVESWSSIGCYQATLMKSDKAVCDLDSKYANECCIMVE